MATTVRVIRRVISQPTDGADFIVTISPSLSGEADYAVRPSVVAGGYTVGWDFPEADRALAQFRARSTAALADGAVVQFTLVRT